MLGSAADALVPQHLVVGNLDRQARRCIGATRAQAGASRTESPSAPAIAGCIAKAAASCFSPRTKPTPERLFGRRRTALPTSRTASTITSCTASTEAVNPRAHRHQGGGALQPHDPARRDRSGAPAPALRLDGRPTPLTISTRLFADRIAEADEFYATAAIPADLSADAQNVQRQAFAGMLWSKQFYHYVVNDWLKGDPGSLRRPTERLHGPQPRVDAPVQRRRHFHARQVGISVVCGLGPGISLRPAGAGRSRVRQRAAHPHAARMVHASQRSDSRV